MLFALVSPTPLLAVSRATAQVFANNKTFGAQARKQGDSLGSDLEPRDNADIQPHVGCDFMMSCAMYLFVF